VSVQSQALARQLDRPVGEVDAGRDGAVFHPLVEVGPRAHPDLEHALPLSSREPSELGDVGLELVPGLLDLVEVILAGGGGVRIARPAGFGLPVRPDVCLGRLIVHRRKRFERSRVRVHRCLVGDGWSGADI